MTDFSLSNEIPRIEWVCPEALCKDCRVSKVAIISVLFANFSQQHEVNVPRQDVLLYQKACLKCDERLVVMRLWELRNVGVEVTQR